MVQVLNVKDAFGQFLKSLAYSRYKKGTVGSWVTRFNNNELKIEFMHDKLIENGYIRTDQGYIQPPDKTIALNKIRSLSNDIVNPQWFSNKVSSILLLNESEFIELRDMYVEDYEGIENSNFLMLEYGEDDVFVILNSDRL